MTKRIAALASAAFLVASLLVLSAAPASAQPVCIGQLGQVAKGAMATVTGDWRNDFLGFGQPAGFYAVTIAQIRTNCP